ncbi:FMN-binding protein [Shewanella violacea]|uniref:FMN-binding domain protein n=1 Tax=Shewanella violacea (strain JCM 10179 / CIP 106290 / LMG 19151 / DSS12) TaxID=637905 RepID=D4ZC37_SHEVD|nr:FMN-binding protein [Shewanella violacea]BAJ03582.1 FMN-binding domain protein [Shewanella violacea DSS12]
MKLTPLCILACTFIFNLAFSQSTLARGVYQEPQDFISQAFNAPAPKAKVFWIDDEAQAVIEEILSHRFKKMRLRYWQQESETIWILEEIGKESPITVAIHIKDQAIAQTKVLVYRESRGDEVRHDFFTDQFKSAKLKNDLKLDQHIDGITGATLSVRALTKLSRIALWLDAHVTKS